MERQRSFSTSSSFKSTRFLTLSFAVSSSILFLTSFTFWLYKSTTPFIVQEAIFESNRTSLVVGLKPLTAHNFTSLGHSLLTGPGFTIPENASGFGSNSALRKDYESEMLQDDEGLEDAVDVNVNDAAEKEDSVPVPETPPEKIEVIATGGKVGANKIITAEKTETTSLEKTESSRIGIDKKESKAISVEKNIEVSRNERIKEKSARECDVTKGKWVYDESYPLYTNRSCPLIDDGFDCAGNGRLDNEYMKWRWQPQDCDLPRFNATKMLNLIRGKRLVFVGDSINRNQWESMLCMLMAAVKDPSKVYETHGRKITKEKGNYSFRFVDYKCSVEYYVSHFLVHESKARVGQKRVQTLRIDAIDHGSSRWRGADILIFNTAHWWSHSKTKAGINYYQEGNQVHPRLDVSTAFKRALMTWAAWADRHINRRKTQVFFRSSAPSHFRGGQWNSGGHCTEATQPLNETTAVGHSEKNTIAEEVIKIMKTHVTFLDITSLSGLRIDGHPSIYGKKPGKRSGSDIQDCSHWCLPGVPDTWNQLLYFHLQSRQANFAITG